MCGTFGNLENGLFTGFQEWWVALKFAGFAQKVTHKRHTSNTKAT